MPTQVLLYSLFEFKHILLLFALDLPAGSVALAINVMLVCKWSRWFVQKSYQNNLGLLKIRCAFQHYPNPVSLALIRNCNRNSCQINSGLLKVTCALQHYHSSETLALIRNCNRNSCQMICEKSYQNNLGLLKVRCSLQ